MPCYPYASKLVYSIWNAQNNCFGVGFQVSCSRIRNTKWNCFMCVWCKLFMSYSDNKAEMSVSFSDGSKKALLSQWLLIRQWNPLVELKTEELVVRKLVTHSGLLDFVNEAYSSIRIWRSRIIFSGFDQSNQGIFLIKRQNGEFVLRLRISPAGHTFQLKFSHHIVVHWSLFLALIKICISNHTKGEKHLRYLRWDW